MSNDEILKVFPTIIQTSVLDSDFTEEEKNCIQEYKKESSLAVCNNVTYDSFVLNNPKYEGKFKIVLVPNITNICYGRGVGYKIEEIVLPENVQKISATKIRDKMREEGKL